MKQKINYSQVHSKIEITPAKVIHIKKNAKYLLVMPRIENSKELSDALTRFFGNVKFFILEAKDVNAIKIMEVMEEHEKKVN